MRIPSSDLKRPTRSGVGKPWPVCQFQPAVIFVRSDLLEPSHVRLFIYYLWLLSMLQQQSCVVVQGSYGPQCLKYVLSEVT